MTTLLNKKIDWRFIVFLTFFAVFILFAPIIFFYSLGWYICPQEKELFQSGGIFLNIENKNAAVLIDDEPYQSVPDNGLLIKNLKPRIL